MEKTGRIGIYDYDDNLLDSVHYYSIEGRKRVMETWKEEYRKSARYFKIFPFALDKGLPKPLKKVFVKKVIKDLPKEPISRPIAKYDNPQWNNY